MQENTSTETAQTQESLEEHAYVNANRYITFFLQDERYGVDIYNVKEIIAHMRATKIPKAPTYLKGVINLRGIIIPVIDTRLKFGLEETDMTMYSAIIIIEIAGASVGFIVDKVEEVVSIPEDNISETPKFSARIDSEYIKHIARVENDVVMVLNLETLLSEQEMELIDTGKDEIGG